MRDALREVNAQSILSTGAAQLQSLGMTFRKAEYISDFAARVQSGASCPAAGGSLPELRDHAPKEGR